MLKWLFLITLIHFSVDVFSQISVEINGQTFELSGEIIKDFQSDFCTFSNTNDSSIVHNEDGTFHYRQHEGKLDTTVKYILIRNDSLIYQFYNSCSGFKTYSKLKLSLKSSTKSVKIYKDTPGDSPNEIYWIVEVMNEMVDDYLIETEFEESIGQTPWLFLYFSDKNQAKKYYNIIKKGK